VKTWSEEYLLRKQKVTGHNENNSGNRQRRAITKVKIGDNNETPGLGAKAKDKPFISQFEGIAPKEPLTVVKNAKTKWKKSMP